MDNFKDIIEFRSTEFVPFLPEAAQVNPGRYGAELAFWLSSVLARRGIVTSYPESEDWGWYIEYSAEEGSEFAVHCGNVNGTSDRWLLSLRRFPRKMFGRDKPAFTEASTLIEGLKDVVHSLASATEITWYWDDASA
jgi:hypothetical protein